MPIMPYDDETLTKGYPVLALDPAAIPWREDGSEDDRRAVLRACLNIGGALVNMIALEVFTTDPDGQDCMDFSDPRWSASALWQPFGMDGHAETVEIEGRRYAIFACPYSG